MEFAIASGMRNERRIVSGHHRCCDLLSFLIANPAHLPRVAVMLDSIRTM
jgi:hypothetical protein